MLHPFQREGVDFIHSHYGGLILDDPGLGKTRQGIVAAKEAGRYPILIVCPSPLRPWWAKEIHELYPQDNILVAGQAGRFGENNDQHVDELVNDFFLRPRADVDWVIVHYTGLSIETQAYADVLWGTIVADEVHYIKNRKAERTKAANAIVFPDTFRIGLTATPMSTCPADVWSQLAWVSDEFRSKWPSYWQFFDEYVKYTLYRTPQGHTVKKPNGLKDEVAFAEVLAQYAISRRKATVAPQLPKLQETVLPLPLEDRQATVYAALKKDAEVAIRDTGTEGKITGIVVKNALSRMMHMERWLSCPWAIDSGVRGIKLEWLKEWTDGYSEQAVIMTHFVESAKTIAQALGVDYIVGDVPQEDREAILAQWKQGETQFLVGTIGTLGTGLNLAEAYTLVFYDQVYDPIQMRQAKDRIHRITTDHPVQAIYLVVEGTSNEVVYQSFSENLSRMELVKRFVEHINTKEARHE